MDVPSADRGSSNFALNPSLRGYLETNADIVTRIARGDGSLSLFDSIITI